MRRRWRGRPAALAILATFLALGSAAAVVGGRSGPIVRVSLPDGRVVAEVPLPADRTVTLRYRNSLYGTQAEERFAVLEDGRLHLVELRAEQLAVLEEYYAIDTPAHRTGNIGSGWTATPAHAPTIDRLRVAATDLGRRTLVAGGHDPLELWRLVDDTAPTVTIEVVP